MEINFLLPISDNLGIAYLRIKVIILKFAVDSAVTVHCILSNILTEHYTPVFLWVSSTWAAGQKLSS